MFVSYASYAIANACRIILRMRSLSNNQKQNLFHWLDDYSNTLRLDVNKELRNVRSEIFKKNFANSKNYLELFTKADSRIEKLSCRKSDPLLTNLVNCSRGFDLDSLDERIFHTVYLHNTDERMKKLISLILNRMACGNSYPKLLAKILGVGEAGVIKRIQSTSPLIKCGLLSHENRYNIECPLELPDVIVNVLCPPPIRTWKQMCNLILGASVRHSLKIFDYAHLGSQANMLLDILKGGINDGAEGINILLYGEPGTGKTELCKTIAHTLKASLYDVGGLGSNGIEPDRKARLTALVLALSVLSKMKHSLILFDEMEDLHEGSRLNGLLGNFRSGSKVYMNRLLESNSIPILWTCNDISLFEPSFLRRFTFAIEVKKPPEAFRRKIWKKELKKEGISLPSTEVEALAREFDYPPSFTTSAIRAARLSGGGTEVAQMAIRSIIKVMRGGQETPPAISFDEHYDPDLLNSDLDLVALTERLASRCPQPVSFCLYGAPGSGKSAWARHFAKEIGRSVVEKKSSDIFSMWVGGSEKNIASAFKEAIDKNAILILDEADSLLIDRSRSIHSWEVTQVNEMLTWMERHPLPFICTTNLMSHIDEASLRRFTFKVRFGYLNPRQVELAFERILGVSAPKNLADFTTVTPGDFAVVLRKAKALGEEKNTTALCAMLKLELKLKSTAPKPIGFR